MFIREADYVALIRQDRLDEILLGDNSARLRTEEAVEETVKSYLRHRYDVEKGLKGVLAFSVSKQYEVGDLVEYTEPVYTGATTYSLGQRVSYAVSEFGVNIYEYIYATPASGKHPTNATYWKLICADKTLFSCKVAGLGSTLVSDLVYTTTADYLTGFGEITGWERNSMYFERFGDKVFMYPSAGDLSSGNYAGFFDYKPRPESLPVRREIQKGFNQEIQYGGYITVQQYITDGVRWSVTVTNNFEQKDTRNQMLLRIYLKMIIYELHYVINPRNIPEHRGAANEDALDLLKKIAKGEITADLPTYDLQPQKGQRFTWGKADESNYQW